MADAFIDELCLIARSSHGVPRSEHASHAPFRR
jgi:hypothetical protein